MDVTFESGGERCAGWLYDAATRGPAIVMGHGFGLSRYAGLEQYAERFAAAGLSVLVFDHRHFGDSAGTPRQLIDIRRQLADWRAAVAFVRARPEVDPDRVALWGTSFSGGHVAAIAAEDPRIAAVVSQVPFSGLGGGRRPLRPVFLARLLAAALRDELTGRRGGSRPIPLAGEPGTFAAFVEPGAVAQLRDLHRPGHEFVNAYTPRITLRLPRYRPFARAGEIRCPWLVVVCDDDTVTPADPAVTRSAAAPRVEVERYPAGHFDVYSGALFERVAARETEFLRRHLIRPR